MEMHLYYFSPRTLEEMLRKADFTVMKMVNQGRFLRLGYLVTRIEAYSSLIANGMGKLITVLGLKDRAVPINLGDLFTAFARKE